MRKYWFFKNMFQLTVRSQRAPSTQPPSTMVLQQAAPIVGLQQQQAAVPFFVGPQWQIGQQQQQGQNSQCYWTGIWPNCHTGCQRRDIVAIDLARPVGSLCQTGRLRYCCSSSRGWDRDRHRPHHEFEDNRRPGRWNDWNNGPSPNRPIFGLDLNIG